mgnify:CR=1 FL=1
MICWLSPFADLIFCERLVAVEHLSEYLILVSNESKNEDSIKSVRTNSKKKVTEKIGTITKKEQLNK